MSNNIDLNPKFGGLLKDIRFWIVFFFLLRLYGITFPPLEVGHNWRQTDGLMIARNFYERDSNIFYPTVDLAGEKSGIVGCEFPTLNYLVYLVSLLFGYDHWYGRLIVLLSSSIGVLFFYKLIRKYFDESTAFNSSIILIVSLWFSYSRKTIPDVFAASLCIVGLYCAFGYFEKGKPLHLLIFFILALLGCLSKILAATLLTVLLFPMLDRNIPLGRKIALSLFSLCILSLVCWWYFVWVPYLNTTYGFGGHFFMGLSFTEGASRILQNLNPVLKRFYGTPLKYFGFAVFLYAVFLVIHKKLWLPLGVFLLPFISFIIILIKTGTSIIGDHYYILTAIPSMAFITGYGLTKVNSTKIATIVLTLIGIECIAAQIYDFRIRQPYRSLAELEVLLDEVSQPSDLIAVNADFHNPTAMYFTHRRGWATPNSNLSDSTYRNELRDKGCQYILIVKKLYGDLNLEHPVVHDSEYFKIYRINDYKKESFK
ncbi:glycosyltransferase family 39 protein [Chryseolinea sp. H1M3-3]|uniref:ArnT family glycosyltransferase n=1 Tax=Chryseolinea sp. H1M3-3 TaxID=3034144 RepID=UPI0023EB963D|nr:glycosyltransferase family 39 protein [Chryseolinea sp. H1M3-3]